LRLKKARGRKLLTPGEVLTWIKENFTIDKHLNYSQVDNIVQYWRKKHNAFKESYINQHSLNSAGLPFLRAHLTLNLRINNANTIIKIALWSSDFQINRIRLTSHLFIDGTFTVSPSPYSQLITFMIKDPNTGFIKPVLWALVNSKEEETYYQLFLNFKQIITSNGLSE